MEVIRGPGSANHGGYAELAVINIITKGAAELDGFVLNGLYGQTSQTYSRRLLGFGLGKKYGDWNLSSHVFIGQGNRSDQNYTDNEGSTYNLQDNSKLDPAFINIGASNDRWNFRVIYDRYNTTDQSAYGTNAPIAVQNNFESILIGAKYTAPLSKTLSLVPEIHLKQMTPWNSTNPESNTIPQLYYDVKAQEIKGTLSLRAEINPQLIAYFGLEGMIQSAHDSTATPFSNGSNEISYYNKAAFSEINWNTDFADFTLGFRYQGRNIGGDAVVPRLSAVKQMGDFHAKLIYGWGFRVPGIENLRFNSALKPEITKTTEIEFGDRISPTMFTTLNLFRISLSDPIIYGYANGEQSYQNSTEAGTYGLEWDYKIRSNWGYLDLNYSYFNTKPDEPIAYQVPGHPEALLGMANHKVGANVSFKILNDRTRLNVSETFYSQRYGYDYDANSDSGLSIREFNPSYLTNLFLESTDVFYSGLSLGLGVFNLLNQDFKYIQAYDGSHPPIPGSSRDWILKASYKVNL